MSTRVASLHADLSLNDNMTRGLRDASGAIDTFGGRLDSVGSKMQVLGGAMTAAGGVMVGGFSVAVREAMRFESSMGNAASITGTVGAEAQRLNDEILAIGSASRAGPQAAAEAYYQIVSGVQDATTHTAILNAAIATSEAGNSDLTATTTGLISVMNAYGLEAEDAAYVSDTLTRTVGMGVGTMDEFAGALGPASGLANDLGVSFDQLASNTAYLTSTGSSASEAVTQLEAIMTSVLNPNEKMKNTIADLGYESGRAMVEQLGLAGAMQAVAEQTGGLDGELAATLGSTEALGGAIGLINDRAGEFGTAFTEGLEGATASAREIQLETAAAQFDLLKSSAQGLAIEIGAAVLPIINEMMTIITPLVGRLADWISANPQIAAGVGVIAAGLVTLGPVLAAAGTSVRAFGGAIKFASGPMLPLVAAIALGVQWLSDQPGGLAGSLSRAATAARQLVLLGLHFLNEGIQTVSEKVTGFANGAMVMAQTAFNKAKTAVTDLINLALSPFGTNIEELGPKITTLVDGALTTAKTIFGEVKTAVMNVVTLGLNPLKLVVQRLEGAISEPLNAVKGAFDSVFGPIGDVVGGVVSALAGIPGAVSDAAAAISGLNTTGEGAGGLFGSGIGPDFDIIGGIREWSTGTPWTGSGSTSEPAGIVHRQEAVVPAGGMRVIPSPRGLMLDGGGGGGGMTINVSVNEQGLMTPSQRDASARDFGERIGDELKRRQ